MDHRSIVILNLAAIEKLACRLRDLLPSDRFLRGITLLVSATAFGQVLTVLAAPLLSRIYSPEEFGALGVYASALGILSVIAALGYSASIPLPEKDGLAANILMLCFGLVSMNTLVVTILVFIFGDWLIAITKTPILDAYLWLLPVGFLALSSYNTLNYWSIRNQRYGTIARTRMMQSIGQVVTQVVLGILKFGTFGLLLGHLIGQSAGVSSLAQRAWASDRHRLRQITSSRIWLAARRYRRFPIYMMSGNLLTNSGLRLPALLLAGFYGAEVAGWFYFTQKLLALPVQMIGRSVKQAFIGEAAPLAREDPVRLKAMHRAITFRMLAVGLVPCTCLCVGGRWIFEFLFGEMWIQSGIYVQIMSVVFFVKLSADSAIDFSVIDRPDLGFSWSLIRLILVSAGICSAGWLGMIPTVAILLYSIAMVGAYILALIMWRLAVNRIILAKCVASN